MDNFRIFWCFNYPMLHFTLFSNGTRTPWTSLLINLLCSENGTVDRIPVHLKSSRNLELDKKRLLVNKDDRSCDFKNYHDPQKKPLLKFVELNHVQRVDRKSIESSDNNPASMLKFPERNFPLTIFPRWRFDIIKNYHNLMPNYRCYWDETDYTIPFIASLKK